MIVGISLKIFMFLAIVTGIIIVTHDGTTFPKIPGLVIALTCYISCFFIFILIGIVILLNFFG